MNREPSRNRPKDRRRRKRRRQRRKARRGPQRRPRNPTVFLFLCSEREMWTRDLNNVRNGALKCCYRCLVSVWNFLTPAELAAESPPLPPDPLLTSPLARLAKSLEEQAQKRPLSGEMQRLLQDQAAMLRTERRKAGYRSEEVPRSSRTQMLCFMLAVVFSAAYAYADDSSYGKRRRRRRRLRLLNGRRRSPRNPRHRCAPIVRENTIPNRILLTFLPPEVSSDCDQEIRRAGRKVGRIRMDRCGTANSTICVLAWCLYMCVLLCVCVLCVKMYLYLLRTVHLMRLSK